jgi:hypothetical protein
MIEIAPERSEFILNQFKSDYDLMASSLQVIKQRLILLNPKFIKEPVEQKRMATAPAVGQRNLKQNLTQHIIPNQNSKVKIEDNSQINDQ